MHALFNLTVYTGQQLLLEGLHRWLQRPCAPEPEQRQQRRNSLRSLLLMLLKTAATGVLATVLDAAIEYRRRQLLAAASSQAGDSGTGSRLGPLGGVLSRAGISAWKERLLLCIDELERHAETYGVEARQRFSEGKPGGAPDTDGASAGKGPCGPGTAGRFSRAASRASMGALGGGEEGEGEAGEHRRVLARTVEQLRSLVKDGEEGSDARLEREVDSLLDSLLGEGGAPWASGSSAPGSPTASSAAAGCGPDSLCSGEAGPGKHQEEEEDEEGAEGTLCHICMDRHVSIQVEGCRHEFCFQCARRLCASQDHQVPQCPFCRQTINGFAACP